MRGPKPKPTKLKVLKGTRKSRINQNEPQPKGVPDKPKFLKGRASSIWDEYAPELIELGVMTKIDGHTFAVWCTLAARFERDGPKMPTTQVGQMRALAACFGLEPSARNRIGVVTPSAEHDKLARFLGDG